MSRYGQLLRKASASAGPAVRHLTGRGPARGVVFHHIPKCGGVSISSALGAAYAPWLVRNIPAGATVDAVHILDPGGGEGGHPWRRIHELRTHLLAMYLSEGARCVTGHVQFSADIRERFAASHRFVTVLRDPLDRFVSQFVYSTQSSRSYDRLDIEWREEDLARVGPRWGRSISSFLAGIPVEEATDDRLLADTAKQALRQLDVVGFLDDLDGFGRAVREQTGAALMIGRENRSPGGRTVELRRDPLMERVREHCAVDLEVYGYARELFTGR